MALTLQRQRSLPCAALADGPLAMAAPGLLTNIATVVRELPELVKHVQQLFAVMGTVRVQMALFTKRL